MDTFAERDLVELGLNSTRKPFHLAELTPKPIARNRDVSSFSFSPEASLRFWIVVRLLEFSRFWF
jgi:hypothetical protein